MFLLPGAVLLDIVLPVASPRTALQSSFSFPFGSPGVPHGQLFPSDAFGDLITVGPLGTGGSPALFLVSLILTTAIESGVILLIARKALHLPHSFGKLLAAGILPSVITLIASYSLASIGLIDLGSGSTILILEGIIVVVETLVIKALLQISFGRSLLLSFVANLISFVCGVFGLPVGLF